jgi:coenzyme F420-0:L-glutamate ligase/coenzyme F420-1:gamma-L-glutamate ligase
VARLTADAVPGLPEIGPGDDLGGLIVTAAVAIGGLQDGDVLAVAHKVVSKAEGRTRRLADVAPGRRARSLADRQGKDPRAVELVLAETAELMRSDHGVLICRTHHGFVCANAGVDASNAAADGEVIQLPEDPDASARGLRTRLRELTGTAPAVLVTDSFGRAWRHGQSEITIGCAGFAALDDWRGRVDARGRELRATWIAIADQAAAAADLVRSKDSREPAVRLRGLAHHVTPGDGPGAAVLLRPVGEDLFR